MIELALFGNHYQMGKQHGEQVASLRTHILSAMEERLQSLANMGDTTPYEKELLDIWQELGQNTLTMLQGIAEVLRLPWELFFRYTVASYLEDRLGGTPHTEGCTAWAATDPITRDGSPILAKNRDYRPTHLPLQGIARATPDKGYAYIYVTSAGSPGVFSSGMNEVGVAVADTHVVSLDIGPGLARYSVMMDILETCASVGEALDYIFQVPHLGEGTLALADARGSIAVVELGHSRQNVIPGQEGAVVTTNNFVSPGLAQAWRDTNPPRLRGNSQARREAAYQALYQARGTVDVHWAQSYMASHQDPLSAMCRHLENDGTSETISSVIFVPQQRTVYFANGRPCRTPYKQFTL